MFTAASGDEVDVLLQKELRDVLLALRRRAGRLRAGDVLVLGDDGMAFSFVLALGDGGEAFSSGMATQTQTPVLSILSSLMSRLFSCRISCPCTLSITGIILKAGVLGISSSAFISFLLLPLFFKLGTGARSWGVTPAGAAHVLLAFGVSFAFFINRAGGGSCGGTGRSAHRSSSSSAFGNSVS